MSEGGHVTEFECVECGIFVYAFGLDKPPPHSRCSVCDWLVECVAPPERDRVRQFLRPDKD